MNSYQKHRSKKFVSEINVVPYIDVMLVLLVIFMITTPLLTEGVKVNLPKAQAAAISKTNKEPIIVSVDKFGRYYLNIATDPMKPVSAEDLSVRLAAELQIANENKEERQVYVKGDEACDYGKVVSAMVLAQRAGVKNIGLITEDNEPKHMAKHS